MRATDAIQIESWPVLRVLRERALHVTQGHGVGNWMKLDDEGHISRRCGCMRASCCGVVVKPIVPRRGGAIVFSHTALQKSWTRARRYRAQQSNLTLYSTDKLA